VKNAAVPLLDHDPLAEEVAAFLVANPDFLARRPELYGAILAQEHESLTKPVWLPS